MDKKTPLSRYPVYAQAPPSRSGMAAAWLPVVEQGCWKTGAVLRLAVEARPFQNDRKFNSAHCLFFCMK